MMDINADVLQWFTLFFDKVYVTYTDKSARDVLKNAVTEKKLLLKLAISRRTTQVNHSKV